MLSLTNKKYSYIQLNFPNNSAMIDCAHILCLNAFGRQLCDQSCPFPNGLNPIAHLKYFQWREDTLIIMHIINNLIFIKPLYALW